MSLPGVRSALLALGGSYTVIVAGLWLFQDRLVYPGAYLDPTADEVATAAKASGLTRVDLTGPDGPVSVWARRSGRDRLLLYFHGNGELAATKRSLADAADAEGFDFVAAEYRGFADLPGQPSESALLTDARVVWDWVVGPAGYAPDRVVVQGGSLGGGVAVALTADVDVAGVVLSSTFDCLAAVAADRYPGVPVRTLIRSPFDSVARAPRVTEPVLQLHSADDETIPFANATRLRDALGNVTFVAVEGWGHSGQYLWEDPVAHAAWRAFLARVVPATPAPAAPASPPSPTHSSAAPPPPPPPAAP